MVDARHWLALARAPGGRATLGALLQELGTPEALFTAPERRLRTAGLSDDAVAWLTAPDPARLDADERFLAETGTTLVVRGSPFYPPLLAASPDAPLVLFVRGDASALRAPQLAIVGSRNPSANGVRDAEAFAAELARAGLVITSGLARGIDGAAHHGALRGGGRTVAVCATGLDRVFPGSHRDLARRIAAQGALCSEFPPGTQALKHHFPLRNRIIAGLSLGTLVVEAAAVSGSLITARLALEAGREVFAIPGSIHNPLAKGCHRLIRDGAKLVETANDVIEELGALAEFALAPRPTTGRDDARAAAHAGADTSGAVPDADGMRVLAQVGWEPTPFDLIVQRSGLPTPVVSSALLMLELNGKVSSAAGGRYSRSAPHEGER